jgi:hypoxanthine phosphoribosyltransferase
MAHENGSGLVRILIDENQLQDRIGELATEIDRDYADLGSLLCVGILKGSVFFMVDLLKRMKTPMEIDFLQTSSYRSGTTPGEVRIRKDVDVSIRGKHVLLIEDIVDTGYTVNTILELLRFRGARSVRLCSLLDKAEARKIPVPIDYSGFTIDDVFVIGFGLDIDERFRDLPYIGVWEGEISAEAADGDAPH